MSSPRVVAARITIVNDSADFLDLMHDLIGSATSRS